MTSITSPDPRSSHGLPALESDVPACQTPRVNLHLLLSQMPGSHIGLLSRNLPLRSSDTACSALPEVGLDAGNFFFHLSLVEFCLFQKPVRTH